MKANGQLQIMTYNLRFDNPGDKENAWTGRREEVVQLLDYYAPDFFGTQEGLYSQIDYILKNLPNYDFTGIGRDGGTQKGEYSALFYDKTKFDLIKTATFWLSESQDTASVGWDAALTRICTYGAFQSKASGDTLYVFNAHFDHIGKLAREMSAKLILKKIEEFGLSDKKVIVMGDFNSTPETAPIQALREKLDDALAISRKPLYGPPGTFNAFDHQIIPQDRIDYIFVKNWKVLRYRHINDKRRNGLCVSDHLPVLAEME
jgi:endonuclease/exonuclease/phosphatase family metal-dependent hydrolase